MADMPAAATFTAVSDEAGVIQPSERRRCAAVASVADLSSAGTSAPHPQPPVLRGGNEHEPNIARSPSRLTVLGGRIWRGRAIYGGGGTRHAGSIGDSAGDKNVKALAADDRARGILNRSNDGLH